jgi:hypothetical protein
LCRAFSFDGPRVRVDYGGHIIAGTRANFFIIFIDAIFTTLLKRPFTNAFDVTGAKALRGCLCRARHAD